MQGTVNKLFNSKRGKQKNDNKSTNRHLEICYLKTEEIQSMTSAGENATQWLV